MNALTILFLGFLLGIKHATDADHVVAVTTIVSRARKLRHAAMVGITWGVGHTLMIVTVGIMIILFHVSIPVRLQLIFEFIVAMALVLLGLLNISGMRKHLFAAFSGLHSHFHSHDRVHIHVHAHNNTLPKQIMPHEHVSQFVSQHGILELIRPLIVGVIHGLAGSAAIALLVLGSISDAITGFLYLGIFSVGTIVGMTVLTTLLGIPIVAGSKKFARFDRAITIGAGCISIIYGIYFGYHIGITEGLFRQF